MHLVLACITAYNALAELLPLLPCAALPGTPAARHHASVLCKLSSMLRFVFVCTCVFVRMPCAHSGMCACA